MRTVASEATSSSLSDRGSLRDMPKFVRRGVWGFGWGFSGIFARLAAHSTKGMAESFSVSWLECRVGLRVSASGSGVLWTSGAGFRFQGWQLEHPWWSWKRLP